MVSNSDTRRIGQIGRNENNPDCPLHVLEVEASTSSIDVSKDAVWPDGAPSVDGVLICYDASDEVSFRPVENLLRKLEFYASVSVLTISRQSFQADTVPYSYLVWCLHASQIS